MNIFFQFQNFWKSKTKRCFVIVWKIFSVNSLAQANIRGSTSGPAAKSETAIRESQFSASIRFFDGIVEIFFRIVEYRQSTGDRQSSVEQKDRKFGGDGWIRFNSGLSGGSKIEVQFDFFKFTSLICKSYGLVAEPKSVCKKQINANPWISEVSGVGWGILFYQDFALSLKTQSKELLLHW